MSSLIRWAPLWDPFDEDWGLPSLMLSGKKGSFIPPVDVYEKDDNIIVETELAGIEPEKVDVSIEDDILYIQGKSEKKSEVEDKNYYRKEIRSGSFYRSIPLPVHVKGNKASAEAKDGILRISIPKAEETKPKKINVKVNKK